VAQQRLEDMRQYLVGAVAHEDIVRHHAEALRERGLETVGVRVGVQAQRVTGLGTNRREGVRRGAVGVFVGVQLDQVVELGLLARDIRHQRIDALTPESTHLRP